jgi:hypothetical protein
MSIKRMGASKKYADNWESIFGGGPKQAKAAEKTKSAKKKVGTKSKPAGKKAKQSRRKK